MAFVGGGVFVVAVALVVIAAVVAAVIVVVVVMFVGVVRWVAGLPFGEWMRAPAGTLA
jgi:hypothetical protein